MRSQAALAAAALVLAACASKPTPAPSVNPADTTELGRVIACWQQQGGHHDAVAALTCASKNGRLTTAQTKCAKKAGRAPTNNQIEGRLSECLPS